MTEEERERQRRNQPLFKGLDYTMADSVSKLKAQQGLVKATAANRDRRAADQAWLGGAPKQVVTNFGNEVAEPIVQPQPLAQPTVQPAPDPAATLAKQGLTLSPGFQTSGDRVPVGRDGLPLGPADARGNRLIQGKQQLGTGLDVTFDQSVPQSARQAFVANSSGQMSPEEAGRRELAHQQWLARQPQPRVFRQQSGPNIPADASDRTRRELTKAWMSANQSNVNNIRDNANKNVKTDLTPGLTAAQVKAQEALTKQYEATAGKAVTDAQAQKIQLELANPETTPERRAQIMEYIEATRSKGSDFKVLPGGEESGFVEGQGLVTKPLPPWIVDNKGNAKRAKTPGTQADPIQKLDTLDLQRYKGTKDEAAAKAAYVKKYGKLPEDY